MEIVERLKDSTKGKRQFNPSFCNIHVNSDGYAEIQIDIYEQYREFALWIAEENNFFEDPLGITDDDTLHDFLHQYEDDLGQMQKDYPNLTLGDIMQLFTWNTMCQQRAFFPGGISFESKQIYL